MSGEAPTANETIATIMAANAPRPCLKVLPVKGFFSEAYLDAPVEALLPALRHVPVRRDTTFEATSLACRD